VRRILWVFLALGLAAPAQTVAGSLASDLRNFVQAPAVAGYEQALADHIARELQAFSPRRDNLGDVIVSLRPSGGGTAPLRLIAAPLDEPGYVVSGITADGYLRLQRLPTRGAFPLFNELANAQPLRVGTAQGTWIHGVMTGLSVHLQPGRIGGPNPDDMDNLYVDIGARSAAQVRAAGVDILSPVALDRRLYTLADGQLAGYSIGDRYGAAALVEALRHLELDQLAGPVAIAFVTQQWTHGRGLARVRAALEPETPAETILVGRAAPAPGRGRGAPAANLAYWNIPVAYASTPAEMVDGHELQGLIARLETALGETPAAAALPAAAPLPEPPLPARPTTAPTPTAVLQALTAQYGVNPHEVRVRHAIEALLPPWAQPTTDDAGNLILHWGDAGPNAPKLLFVAHQDEIGFEVTAIAPDGHLELRTRGGGILSYYIGHPILVHAANGMHPGVLELPEGWQARGFKLAGRIPLRADIGARSAAEVAQLGIAVGDSVTIPKKYRALLGTRASARAFDDRVGDAALIAAAWALGPSLPGRDITLAWSTGEEIGLVGASALAQRLAAAGRTPDYVFAIDTFVSSDTPLESHRFADTPIGQGFVIRAVDDSSLSPWPLARRLQAMAVAAHIPVQLGATGGGNDGSVFLPYGSIDLPLGWPLRTSHSPGEVIDTRDLDGLAGMIATLAHDW